MAAVQSTEAEIAQFLDCLRDDAGIRDFIPNLGQDLVASGVLREAEFGKQPLLTDLHCVHIVHIGALCENVMEPSL